MSCDIIKVGKDERFHTIKDALAVACKGDEIVIEGGVYKESIKIEKDIKITGVSSSNGERPLIIIGKNHHFDVNAKVNIYNIEICQNEKPRYYIPEPEGKYTSVLDKYCKNSVDFDNNQLIRIYDDCVFENCVIRDTVRYVVPVFCFSGSNGFYNCTFTHSLQSCICVDTPSFCRVSSCKFNNNFCGIKTKGQLQVEACEFSNSAFTNVYAFANSKSIIYGSNLSSSYVNIYIEGEGASFKCDRCELSKGKVNNIHICHTSNVLIEDSVIKEAGENGILVEGDSVLKVTKCEIYNNKKGFVIDTLKDYVIESSKIINNSAYGLYVMNCGIISSVSDCDFSLNGTAFYIGCENDETEEESNRECYGYGGYAYEPDFDDDEEEEEDYNAIEEDDDYQEEDEESPLIPSDLLLDFSQLEYAFLFENEKPLFCNVFNCNFTKNNTGIMQGSRSKCSYKKCNISENKENGIKICNLSSIYIEDSVLSNNESFGLFIDGEGEVKLIRCTISNNKKEGTLNVGGLGKLDFILCDNQDDKNIASDDKILSEVSISQLNKEEDDLEAIYKLLKENDPAFYILEEGREEEELKIFKNNINPKSITIKYQNKIIGYAMTSFKGYARCVTLVTLVIDKEYQNKGIGTKLLEALKDWFYGMVEKIVIFNEDIEDNERALKFFTSRGFSKDKEIEDVITFDYDK